jgi:Arc/MetJ-type ribon-helix-helix transcriptional regulator
VIVVSMPRVVGAYLMYGSMYGMQKTTVYLPDDLKRALEQAATSRGRSEAELIREAIRALTGGAARPRLPLFRSGRRGLAERVDQALKGFGQR